MAAEGAIRPESLRHPVPLVYCLLLMHAGQHSGEIRNATQALLAGAEGEHRQYGVNSQAKGQKGGAGQHIVGLRRSFPASGA